MKSRLRARSHVVSVVCGLLAASAVAGAQLYEVRVEHSAFEQRPQALGSESGLKGGGSIDIVDDGPGFATELFQPVPGADEIPPQLYAFFPQAGTLWQDLAITNHVDLSGGGVPFDFDCTDRTYSGHRGHDATIVGFREQQIGVPIFAALDGRVVAAHDGEPDMNTEALGQPANYVALSHGNGQTSWYYHLKRDSVAVSVGQTVTAGTQIGLVGSSGSSTWPHLHFESQMNSVAYEPSAGLCRPGPSYWVNQVPARQTTFVKAFTFANVPFWLGPAGYPWDQVEHSGTYLLGTAATYFKMSIANYPTNGAFRVTYTRPNGSSALDFSGVFYGSFYDGWLWFQMNPGGGLGVVGTWTARFYVNDVLMVTAPFDVVASNAEIVNHAPLGASVSLDPPHPVVADVPFCRVTPPVLYRRDPDYDVVRYRYVWTLNGSVVRDVQSAALADALPKGSVSSGDGLTCTVTPFDDHAVAGPSSSASNGAAPGDSDGDGRADILWRHSAGATTSWLMNGTEIIGGGQVGTVDPVWQIVGSGDYNGDGRADLLWRHSAGAVTIWFMSGNQVIGGSQIATVDPAWQIVGSGDYNGDGRADLLWRHGAGAVTIWLMNGTQVIGGGGVATVDPAWQIVGSRDYNGDGRADSLWRHIAGAVTIWLMNGTQIVGGGQFATVDPAWQIVGSGDYNGDGRADLLWRHSAGAVTIWLMNGTQVIGGGGVATVDLAWQIVGSGDYNGDGRADLLWRHSAGDVTIWLMNGTQVIGGSQVATVDPAWQIVNTS
jgi:sRNA-binding regulator protein Hfq